MGTGNKMLSLVGGIILTALLITFGFNIYKRSETLASSAFDSAENLAFEMLDSSKSKYDDEIGKGSEVINVISQFKNDDISIWVVTNKTSSTNGTQYVYELTSSGSYYTLATASTKSLADAKKTTHITYINTSAKFLG